MDSAATASGTGHREGLSKLMTDTQSDTKSAWSRAQIVLWVLPVVATILFPGLLWILAERPMAARFHLAVAMDLIVAVVALVAFAVFSSGFRRRIRWALALTAITLLVLFQWPILSAAGIYLEQALPIPALKEVFPVAAAVALLWIATRIGDELGFAVITTVGLWIVVVALAIGSIPYATQPAGSDRPSPAAPDLPDVMLIVMDGYTRGDILQEQFGFDNSPFLTDLEDMGFVVADQARSNYSFTYASVASMYNMDYVYDAGEITDDEGTAMRNALAGDSTIIKTFREQGYEVAFVENAWQGSRCSPTVDICIRNGIVERAAWNIGQITIFAPLASAVRHHPFNTVSMEHLETLPEIVTTDRTDGVPRLTIAHILLPHPPFLLDQECNRVNSPVRRAFQVASDELIENRRWFYTDQMTCTNSVLADSLSQIISNDTDTIVMITGDHGSGSTRLANQDSQKWDDAALKERLSIFSAYRVPECPESIYPAITPVNGTRAIASCALNISLDPLPDLSLWSPPGGEGEMTDQADRLN